MSDILQVGKQICDYVEPFVLQDCLDPTTQRVALLAASGTLAFGYLCMRYAVHRYQNRPILNSTVLATASERGDLAMVCRCIAGRSGGYQGPVHEAARKGNVSVLRELLRAKHDASVADSDGNTPLHLACQAGYSDCVQALLPHSKRVLNKANNDGLTPVMLAAKEGKALCVHLLVNARGINLKVVTTNEKSLLDLAGKSGSSATLGVLMEKYSQNSALFPDDSFSTSSFKHAFKKGFLAGVRVFLPHVTSWSSRCLAIADAIQSKRHTLLPYVLRRVELTDLTTSALGKPISQMIEESSLPNKAKLLRIIKERLAAGGAGAGAGAGAARV